MACAGAEGMGAGGVLRGVGARARRRLEYDRMMIRMMTARASWPSATQLMTCEKQNPLSGAAPTERVSVSVSALPRLV